MDPHGTRAEPLSARTPSAGSERAAVFLLLFGGIVLPVIGWLLGAFLLWISTVWTLKQKLIGTFIIPGGLLGPVLLAWFGAEWRVCSGGTVRERLPDGTPKIVDGPFQCETAGGIPGPLLGVLLLGLVLAAIVSAAYLASRMHGPRSA